MINEIDRIGAMEYARQKGRTEGHAEGLAEGRAERSLEIAANLKKEGLSVEVIAKCTGLPYDQIEQLQ